MNTHDHHDDEPLPGEDELKALYRSLPRKEPTPAMDEAVRQAAARALHTPANRRMARWPVAAASAAVLVLAAGLGWRMREQATELQTPPPAATETAPQATPASAASSSAKPVSITEAAAVLPPVASKSARHVSEIHAAPRTMAKVRATPAERVAQPAPAPAPMMAPAPAPATAALPASEHSNTESTAASAPVMSIAAPAPPAPVAPVSEHANQAVRSRVMAMPAMLAPAPALPVDPTAAKPTDTPAQELDKIRQLLAQQRRDEALRRLTAFQLAHPDMALPDDLRAQLPDHE